MEIIDYFINTSNHLKLSNQHNTIVARLYNLDLTSIELQPQYGSSPSQWTKYLVNIVKKQNVIGQKIHKVDRIKKIKLLIKKKFETIQSNQKGWLNSMLEKYKPNIIIDHLITEDTNGHSYLLLDSDDIKHKVSSEFQCQFKKRKITQYKQNAF